jgi:hypothetical protein
VIAITSLPLLAAPQQSLGDLARQLRQLQLQIQEVRELNPELKNASVAYACKPSRFFPQMKRRNPARKISVTDILKTLRDQ